MSFSGEIKEELSTLLSSSAHCRIAELSAILCLCGKIEEQDDSHFSVKIQTENLSVARKCFTLLRKSFNMKIDVSIRRKRGLSNYTVEVYGGPEVKKLLLATCLVAADGKTPDCVERIHRHLLRRDCCRRAFIRGAFLAAGSISDPEKSYHFEIVCSERAKAEGLCRILADLGIEGKLVKRRKYDVVYVKDGSQIVELLGLTGAHLSLMQLENVRIVREMRGQVNRKVNCETANLNKTVSAAVRQMEDIRYIEERIGLKELRGGLGEIAGLRLEYPDASLKELGDMLTPPVGKSGVNHRLRKLSAIAQRLREGKEE